MFTETALIFMITTIAALIMAIIKICFKSKCTKIETPCFNITRDVQIETDLTVDTSKD